MISGAVVRWLASDVMMRQSFPCRTISRISMKPRVPHRPDEGSEMYFDMYQTLALTGANLRVTVEWH